MQCSLQHQILLLSPVTSTARYCVCFGSIPSFFLELFLHWSPVAYWASTDLGTSSFSILSFCLFILFMGFSRQEYWSGLPFPFPVDHIVSDLSTMPAHLGWPHRAWLSFIELDKAVVLVWLDWLVFYDYGFSVSALWCPLATPIVLLGFIFFMVELSISIFTLRFTMFKREEARSESCRTRFSLSLISCPKNIRAQVSSAST